MLTDAIDRLNDAFADRYSIVRELGSGGMAVVYLAKDLKHHRPVAIKVLRAEAAKSLGTDRFLREIEVSARLAHPHILPLHESGNSEGILYFVMPYVEGESLRGRLNREKQLPLDDAIMIVRDVADALGFAHSHGVVHRDIKPENILLGAGHAVVADFGIARAIGEVRGDRLTEAGIVIGTPEYMSPEQAAGSRDFDGRSDLYSLGCVLYEMLTGETPYAGPTAQAVLAKKLTEPLPRASVVRESVPPFMEAALAKLLARAPADRYATAAQFIDALDLQSPTAVTEPATDRAAVVARTPLRSGTLMLALAVAVVFVASVTLARSKWVFGSESGHLPSAAGIPLRAVLYDNPSLAILPLRNLGSEEDGPFVEGLHDDILSALQKIGGLTVISNTSVQRFRNSDMLLPEIAQALRVEAVGEGTVSRGGDRIRVNVQLIDGETDAHLWSDQYDRELTAANLFAIRGEIARAVAEAMQATLTADEETRLDAEPPANLTAYDWRQIALSRCSGCVERGDAYRRALEADPNYPAAWAGLAANYANRVLAFGAPSVLADSAMMFADRAIELAPELAAGYGAKGMAYYAGRGQTARALEYARRAAQLEPGNASRWTNVGVFSAMRGSWVEALDAYWRARRIGPASAMLRGNMAELYAALGLPERATQLIDEGVEIDPADVTVLHYSSYTAALLGNVQRAREIAERNVEEHGQARTHQWAALLAGVQGDTKAALEHAGRALELAPEGLSLESNVHSVPVTLAIALLVSGDRDGADRLFGTAQEQLRARLRRGADDGYTYAELAAMDAARGDAAQAARWLEAARKAGYRYYREIELDPIFDRVRGSAAFERVMRRIRADVAAMRLRVLEQEAELERARNARPL